MLEPLLRTAAAVGLNLDVSSSKALADSLDRAVVRLLCNCMYVFWYSSISFGDTMLSVQDMRVKT